MKCLRFEVVDGKQYVIVGVENTSSQAETFWGGPGQPQFHFDVSDGRLLGMGPLPTNLPAWPFQILASGERFEAPVELSLPLHQKAVKGRFKIGLKLAKYGRLHARSFFAALKIPPKYWPEATILVWSDPSTAPD